MNVVIYARFSSYSQIEQSIEGKLKVCYEYAEQNHYTIIGEYIDRAVSGKYDNRAEFQRVISDSEKHAFEGILVYQLDRFARNRYDSAIYKSKLKKNGLRVLSARENITDDASGILVEGVLESMAEYFSAELSRRFTVEWRSTHKSVFPTAAIPVLASRLIKTGDFMLTRKKPKSCVKYLSDTQAEKQKLKSSRI